MGATFSPEIVLGDGVTTVEFWEIPKLIALALYPNRNVPEAELAMYHSLRDDAERKHTALLRAARAEGHLIPFSRHTGIAKRRYSWGGVVTVDELKQYVASFHLSVRIEEAWPARDEGIEKEAASTATQVEALAGADMAEPAETKARPQVLRSQEQTILSKLREFQHDPMALPKPPPGKSGVKSQVKKALEGNPLFSGRTTFNKAWERMRSFEDITYELRKPTPPKKGMGDTCGGG